MVERILKRELTQEERTLIGKLYREGKTIKEIIEEIQKKP